MIEGKKILLLVTGSIAAYKSVYLVRLLVQAGAEVRVVMSSGALEFVTPLTFSTLSKNPVHSDFTESRDSGTWTSHVEIALWADLVLVAPMSANTLSKMAQGQSDNFLMTVYMSTRCPVMVAPAMDHDMYLHAGTVHNLEVLRSFGHIVLQPGDGDLASGLVGKGRMMEPEEILARVWAHFNPELPLLGLKALVTAGPTYERIDPVRFIGNFSSGKMGYAIAESLAARGAEVTLVSGPVHLHLSHPRIHIVKVVSAEEMLEACKTHFATSGIAVMAAAVADYAPAQIATQKLKKRDDDLTLALRKTPDIASELGRAKQPGQLLIGFALETENELAHASEKLARKNLDMIVLNSLRDEGAGFGTETNKITLIWPGNKTTAFGLKSKRHAADDITNEILKLIRT